MVQDKVLDVNRCETCGLFLKSDKALKEHRIFCNRSWNEGYRMGMETGLVFVKKYCDDYVYHLNKAFKGRKDKDLDGKKKCKISVIRQ